jgi:nucleoside-diphosphate-sugar epimerase
VAITGATGYLGGIICERLELDGWHTVRLVRTPREPGSRRYVIGLPPEPDVLAGVDVLVHCAYDMSLTSQGKIWGANVEGTLRLLEAASDAGVQRTIVLSSMSAYDGTQQLYGRAKLDIEQHARRFGAISVRPGLVYGPRAGGMAGTLGRLTKLPVIPAVASHSHQFTVHEDDFVNAIVAILGAPNFTDEPVGIANPIPVTFNDLIRGLARQHDQDCHLVPVNWRLVYRALLVAERFPIQLPFRADSLLGLAQPAPYVPRLEALDELGVALRRFNQPVPPITGPDHRSQRVRLNATATPPSMAFTKAELRTTD